MKTRLRDILDLLEYNELLKMKEDIKKGGEGIRLLVDNRIKEELKKHSLYCSVCANKIEPVSTTTFTLMFGPDDFKKRASFCATDCLEYFLGTVKKLQEREET